MQILMGAHATLIKINESKVQTKNLLYFIQTSFSSYIRNEKEIAIEYQKHEYHKRVFLIKWLYNMHIKLTKQDVPKMKELLVKRIEKPIKIEFKNTLKRQINVNVEIMEDNFLHFDLNLFDQYFINELKNTVSKYVAFIDYDERGILVDISTNDSKHSAKKLLLKEKTLFYIFSDKNEIFKSLEVSLIKNKLDDYFILLDSTQDDSMEIINKRYKKLRKMYHPDNVFHQKNNTIQEYTEKFQLLQNAYNAIKQQSFLYKV